MELNQKNYNDNSNTSSLKKNRAKQSKNIPRKKSGLLLKIFLQQVMENYTQLCSSIAP